MLDIIVEKPYEFVPPVRGDWWPTIIRALDLQSIWLRRAEGVVELGRVASVLAHSESLSAHARSAELRLEGNDAD